MHNFYKVYQRHAKIQRSLRIQFQENNPTDSRMKGWTDLISQDPLGYCQGSNKCNWSRLTFKSQRHRVIRCHSNQKLLIRKYILVRKYLIFFGVEFLSDKSFIMRFCTKFHEHIVLALILKQPYFWFQKVAMLRWSFTDKQVSHLCRFAENVNQS